MPSSISSQSKGRKYKNIFDRIHTKLASIQTKGETVSGHRETGTKSDTEPFSVRLEKPLHYSLQQSKVNANNVHLCTQ